MSTTIQHQPAQFAAVATTRISAEPAAASFAGTRAGCTARTEVGESLAGLRRMGEPVDVR